ncbi:MAG: S-adenosylmethionine:tRNA ribosyltransferase-isomerase [Prevotella sp.]
MQTNNILIRDYNYILPEERIAKFPVTPRDHSKLLVYNRGNITEDFFYNLPKYLPEHALMVFNNTKVIQARIHFRKVTGALIEVFLLEPAAPADYEQVFQSRQSCSWYCLVGNLKKWKEGSLSREVQVNGRNIVLSARKREDGERGMWVDFSWSNSGVSFSEILEKIGELPIPPYLNRETQECDKETYQTVYSKIKGSVAAPTAGLHFTENVLEDLDKHGIEREELTLHVGAGTFKPVKTTTIEGHVMHTEFISVKKTTIQRLLAYDASAIAVGTTSVRTLESLYYIGLKLHDNPSLAELDLHVGQWEPYTEAALANTMTAKDALTEIQDYLNRNDKDVLRTSTQIIIAPGYKYKIVKMLITNFHQPQSTLLLLVSAFVRGQWRDIYDYALTHDFRFLSYGDSSLIIP